MTMGVIGNQMLNKADAVLEESLNLRMQRHMVNVSNVSNALTPGYRAMGFDFENQLQAAVGDSHDLLMKTSNDKHITHPGVSVDGVLRPDLFVKPTESVGNDGNTVDVDQEMSEMAKNQILYRATIEVLNRQLGMLRYGMDSGR